MIITVPRQHPLPIKHEDIVRNGKIVEWKPGMRTASALARALVNYRKLVFVKMARASAPPQGQSGTTIPWRWRFRTGAAVNAAREVNLRCRATVLPADNGSASNPRWRVVCGGVTGDWRYQPWETTDAPTLDMLSTQTLDLTLASRTAYECYLELSDYSRVVALTVFEHYPAAELDLDANYAPDKSLYRYDGEITDDQHEKLLALVHVLWRLNASHLGNVVPEDVNSPWTRTAASYVNMLAGAGTAVSKTTTRGLSLQAQYHQPVHSDNVEIEWSVYGQNASSAGGAVQLVDPSGVLATLSSFSTAGEWKTATVNLLGNQDLHKCDLHFQGDGTNLFTVEASSLGEYVA